jgi:hypothetical protein
MFTNCLGVAVEGGGLDLNLALAGSERLRQPCLAKNGVRGVTAGYSDRHRKRPLGDRAVPDFVAAFPLPNKATSRGTQQVAKCAVKLGGHLGGGRLGFAQRRDLQIERSRIGVGVVVRKNVERHGRHFG